MQKNPLVSVIVSVFNRPKLTWKSVESLLQQARYTPVQVLLCDDGSNQETKSVLHALCQKHNQPDQGIFVQTVTNSDEPKGVSHANNMGIYAARGEVLVLADNDVVYAPGWLNLGTRLVLDPVNVLAGVKIVSLFNYFYKGQAPDIFSSCGVPVFRNRYGTGCNLIFRKGFLQELGGIFPLGVPDDLYLHDLLFKQRTDGYLITLDSYVQHIGAESTLYHPMIARAYNFLGNREEAELLCPGS